jgi:hypothetical protein
VRRSGWSPDTEVVRSKAGWGQKKKKKKKSEQVKVIKPNS